MWFWKFFYIFGVLLKRWKFLGWFFVVSVEFDWYLDLSLVNLVNFFFILLLILSNIGFSEDGWIFGELVVVKVFVLFVEGGGFEVFFKWLFVIIWRRFLFCRVFSGFWDLVFRGGCELFKIGKEGYLGEFDFILRCNCLLLLFEICGLIVVLFVILLKYVFLFFMVGSLLVGVLWVKDVW